jgi:hypothetical protein
MPMTTKHLHTSLFASTEAGANPMWQLMAGFSDLSIVPDLT